MALRLEDCGAALTVAQLHSALEKSGVSASVSEVKKAASKASKRAPKQEEASAVQETAPVAVSKSQAKAAKVFEQKMKAAEAAMQMHGGFSYAREYDIERKWRECRLFRTAPISTNMILGYIGQHVLGMPRSY